MNFAKETIKKRLSNERKQLSININVDMLNELDKICEKITEIKGTPYTRNAFIEDAINTYISEATSVLKEDYNIDLANDNFKKKEKKEINGEEYFDTAIYPAHKKGFNDAFLKEKHWYPVRIKNDKISKIKYVAIYVGKDTSGITHYGIVDKIIPYKENPEKYEIIFSDIIDLHKKIGLNDLSPVATRSTRYTTLEKLKAANEYKDLC